MKTLSFLRPSIVLSLTSCIWLASLDFGAMQVMADPTVSVRDNGTANGNQLWLVEVAPDPSLFSNTPEGMGGSLAVELDFQITDSEIVAVTTNSADWPNDNPGFNPFTSAMSSGVTFDTTTAFVSLGSELFNMGDPVEVVTIETLGAGVGTLSWGGNMAEPPNVAAYETSRIAQAAIRFDGLAGSATVAALLPGDYNGNGIVEQADLDLVLLNWGEATPPVPPAWINDLPAGTIDQAELDGVLLNWGDTSLGRTAAVPEPSSLALLFVGLAVGYTLRHRISPARHNGS